MTINYTLSNMNHIINNNNRKILRLLISINNSTSKEWIDFKKHLNDRLNLSYSNAENFTCSDIFASLPNYV